MSNISGHVYYDQTNLLTPGIGIQNVPVALYNPVAQLSAVALTDSNGAFTFTNVPNGNYQVIEAWGTAGGSATPVNYATAVPTAVAPVEQEPPLSAISVIPPTMADKLQALTPNLLNIAVTGPDITNLVFFDSPVGDKPLTLMGVNLVGPNLITAANNGTFGSYPAGTAGNTIPPVAPYPGVTPGFIYSTNQTPPDGYYTIYNTSSNLAKPTSVYWATSDHTTGLETGRLQYVNGSNPGAAMFMETINVQPNTNYLVGAWVLNEINKQTGFANPALGLRILDQNGNTLITKSVNPIPAQQLAVWFQNGFVFNSMANSMVTVEVVSLGPAATGNDYSIDDVTMFEVEFVDMLTHTKTMTPSTVYSENGVGDIVTISVNITNPNNGTINNVAFQDILDPHLQFVPGSVTVNGSGTGFGTADPNVGFSLGNMAPGAVKLVQFQATTNTPNSTIVPNTAEVSYDAIMSGNGDNIRATFPTNTANVDIIINNANITTIKSVDKANATTNDVLTYTLTLTNSGNVPANNVVITDNVPAGTTFIAGSVIGATGSLPTLTLVNPIAPGGNAVVSFKVQVDNTLPLVNPIFNTATANYTFTVDPAEPNGATGSSDSNRVTTQINLADIIATKSVDKSFANINDVLTYTITLQNTGNVMASNVTLNDVIPAGTTYVPNSLTGATGTLPNLILNAPIGAGATSIVTFQVKVNGSIPNVNPLENSANVAFNYTIDPALPNGGSGTSTSDITNTQVNNATLTFTKSQDKNIAYIGDVITYSLVVKNTGNVPANQVIINDPIVNGLSYVPNSLLVSVPFSGTPITGINLTNPILPGQSINLSFQVKVDTIPSPNPIENVASVAYSYTVDPENPNGVSVTTSSNAVVATVFRNNYQQQITDLIESVALEEAALAALINAEGAKIQKAVALGNITNQELICINKSVSEMTEALSLLESIMKQKLNIVSCQIDGTAC